MHHDTVFFYFGLIFQLVMCASRVFIYINFTSMYWSINLCVLCMHNKCNQTKLRATKLEYDEPRHKTTCRYSPTNATLAVAIYTGISVSLLPVYGT